MTKSKRLAAGYYEVETEVGTYIVERIDQPPEQRGNGYPPVRWFVTWPGERHPDGDYDTKREALEAISHDVQEGVDG